MPTLFEAGDFQRSSPRQNRRSVVGTRRRGILPPDYAVKVGQPTSGSQDNNRHQVLLQKSQNINLKIHNKLKINFLPDNYDRINKLKNTAKSHIKQPSTNESDSFLRHFILRLLPSFY